MLRYILVFLFYVALDDKFSIINVIILICLDIVAIFAHLNFWPQDHQKISLEIDD